MTKRTKIEDDMGTGRGIYMRDHCTGIEVFTADGVGLRCYLCIQDFNLSKRHPKQYGYLKRTFEEVDEIHQDGDFTKHVLFSHIELHEKYDLEREEVPWYFKYIK